MIGVREKDRLESGRTREGARHPVPAPESRKLPMQQRTYTYVCIHSIPACICADKIIREGGYDFLLRTYEFGEESVIL